MMDAQQPLKVVIVGCGLGGLACAIACRREGLDVTMFEKTSELSEIGAGIQLPPNASRIMSNWNLMDRLMAAGAVVKNDNFIFRWQDGKHITTRPGKDWAEAKFGYAWHVMHRADYQRVLYQEALRLGAKIILGADVIGVDCNLNEPAIIFANGDRITADVIVGADGLRSVVRTSVLGYVKEPEESGDLAYRITIPHEKLQENDDSFQDDEAMQSLNAMWWGPHMHVVLYGIRDDKLANLVLICPDDLPEQMNKSQGDLAEMREIFEDWDPRLRWLLSKVDRALKWKVYSMKELDVWTKGSVALLGDACHPSVPYAASGAAMAVEDGAVLGRLLGHFSRCGASKSRLPELLHLYQDVRKKRTQTTVHTVESNRCLYHLADGLEQRKRDQQFASHDWWDEGRSFPFKYADLPYSHELFGFDAIASADEAFKSSHLD